MSEVGVVDNHHQFMRPCTSCGAPRMHVQRKPNHFRHLPYGPHYRFLDTGMAARWDIPGQAEVHDVRRETWPVKHWLKG